MTRVNVRINTDDSKAVKAAFEALKEQAMILKGRSQALCPVDTGVLRNSAVVDVGENEVRVGYGGMASSYAAIQHENLAYHHNVGQAKYLEQPFNEMEPEIIKAVESAVKEAL